MTQLDNSLQLHFIKQGNKVELVRTLFHQKYCQDPIIGIRGGVSVMGALPLRWGPTTHALSIYFVKAALVQRQEELLSPLLEGKKRCPVASIVRLLYKRTELAAIDLFGSDISGRPLLSKILSIANPYLKRVGPTQIFLRGNILSPSNIKIFLDNKELSSEQSRGTIRDILSMLEKTWKPGKARPQNLETINSKDLEESLLAA